MRPTKTKAGEHKPTPKKAYQTPKVIVYGGIAKLTAAKSSGSFSDGVASKKS